MRLICAKEIAFGDCLGTLITLIMMISLIFIWSLKIIKGDISGYRFYLPSSFINKLKIKSN